MMRDTMPVRIFKKHPHGGWNLEYNETAVSAFTRVTDVVENVEAEPGDVIWWPGGWLHYREPGDLVSFHVHTQGYEQFVHLNEQFQAEARSNLKATLEDESPIVRFLAGDCDDEERVTMAMKLQAMEEFGPLTASLYGLIGKGLFPKETHVPNATRLWLDNADPCLLHMAACASGEDDGNSQDLMVHLLHLLSMENGTPGVLQIPESEMKYKYGNLIFLSLMFLLVRMGYLEVKEHEDGLWAKGFGFTKIREFPHPDALDDEIGEWVQQNSAYLKEARESEVPQA